MSKGDTQQVLTIATLERLKLSVNGNPRFRVTFTNGLVAQTQTDSSVAYSIENSEYRDVPVLVDFTRAGRIFGIAVAPVAYEIPDVEPDERTGLSVWPVLADGKEIGAVIEREDGYQARVDHGESA